MTIQNKLLSTKSNSWLYFFELFTQRQVLQNNFIYFEMADFVQYSCSSFVGLPPFV